MTTIDAKWAQFMGNMNKSPGQILAANMVSAADVDTDDDDDDISDLELYDSPKQQDLTISTKTKKPCLNISDKINVLDLFWKLPITQYWIPQEGIIKKQMKVVCATEEESAELDRRKLTEYHFKESKIVKQTENSNRKTKYKDDRKISAGICFKDVMQCRGKNSGGAMYNCVAITLRMKKPNSTDFCEIHVKIFNTGKLEVPGILDLTLYENVKIMLLNILSPIFAPHVLEYIPPKSDNVIINSNFSVGFNVNRDALYKILRSDKYQMDTIYDPCTYPAVKSKYYFCNHIGLDADKQRGIVQPEDINMKSKELMKSDRYTKVSFMVFRTGSCLIVGNCTEPILYFVYNFVKQLLLDERDKIYVPPTAEEPVNKKLKSSKPRSRKVQVTSPYFSSLKKVDA